MLKNWKTSLLGVLAGIAQLVAQAHSAGASVGHVGNSDWLATGGAILTALVGIFAADYTSNSQGK